MKTTLLLTNLSLALSVAFSIAACSSSTKDENKGYGLKGIDHPDWVTRGSGATGGEKSIFYGVGSVTGIKNPSLARSAAGDRARAEISKVLEVYSASLMKDYQGHVSAGGDASSEEQAVTSAVKTFSANTLNGVEIVEHWIHPVDGTTYALAKLDIEGFLKQIDGAGELSAKVKEQVKRSAEKAFADLEAQEAKKEAAEQQ